MKEATTYLQAHPEATAAVTAKITGGGKKPNTRGAVDVPADFYTTTRTNSFYECPQLHDFYDKIASENGKGGRYWNVADEFNETKKGLREGWVDVLTLSPHMLRPDEGIDNFVKLPT